VIQLQSSWFFVSFHDISNLEEEVGYLRVFIVEFLSSFFTAGGLVCLKDDKKLADQLFTFRNKEFLIQMDDKVVFSFDFNLHNFTFLVFQNPLGKNKSTLSMSLAPFLGLSIIKWETNNALSKLSHDINPEHSIDVFVRNSEERIDFFECTQEVSTGVSSAFLVRS